MNPCPQSGELLDHYRLERLVAIGGMSTVFRAIDTRTAIPVAIKIPHLQRHPLIREWFLPKKQTIRSLRHPGLVQIVDIAHTSRSYVVMEWLEGRLLRDLIDDRNWLSVEHSIQIALELCDALAYIHERGFVHLDLKPENVIVDYRDHIKLIDFDLEFANGNCVRSLLRHRKTCTPDYASPEQIRGRTAGVSSDFYSLGLIFYQMVSGELPFSGVDPAISVNLRLQSDAPAPNELNPEIPSALNDLICQMIARDPKQRPPSARFLSERLFQIKEICTRELVPVLE